MGFSVRGAAAGWDPVGSVCNHSFSGTAFYFTVPSVGVGASHSGAKQEERSRKIQRHPRSEAGAKQGFRKEERSEAGAKQEFRKGERSEAGAKQEI